MANSDHYPSSGKTDADTRPYSGISESSDPTNQPGQYPVGSWGTAFFGGPLPDGTGAPGSGQRSEPLDPTNEPGQTVDGLTGITNAEITETGAPGTQGAQNSGGGTGITYTMPQDGIGPYQNVTVADELASTRATRPVPTTRVTRPAARSCPALRETNPRPTAPGTSRAAVTSCAAAG